MVRGYLTRDEPNRLMLLVNPFTRLSGWSVLASGLVIVAGTVLLAVFGPILYDGLMDVHTGIAVPASALALQPLVAWVTAAVLFLIAGTIWGARPQRIIDYFGMSAVGRLPFLLAGLLWVKPALGQFMPGLLKLAQMQPGAPVSMLAIPGLSWIIVGVFITMLIMLWGLFLNFFALREASGMTTGRAIPVYIGVIIVGELLSKAVITLAL